MSEAIELRNEAVLAAAIDRIREEKASKKMWCIPCKDSYPWTDGAPKICPRCGVQWT